eukprot:CAMPEP_0117040688 /NCGR_PEP_ID=MMETSP0472-20121206/28449_1 /TAXON_ID=693140 ORGANISM="Tiarina fusus, Strain LIS" /NCGR_SAMPLE_ID=MMETSP0472 /ASSEMBLY_ACC=CAM_ASM_000603 /LENGTH=86 /DNA_ID=CAMNT_0004751469 /DNA_START=38 /DNA_END=298 /DNA_ORIENTATION=+
MVSFLRRQSSSSETWADFHKKYHSQGFHYSAANATQALATKRSRRLSMNNTSSGGPGFLSKALGSSSNHSRSSPHSSSARRRSSMS